MTTVASCRHESYDEIALSYIHEYDEKSFLGALARVGFETVVSRLGDGEGSLVCVARPKPDAVTP
jgi:hypothetical protein